MSRFQQRPGESDEEFRARGMRGYRWGGMLLLLIAIILGVIAIYRPEYRTACTIAGFLWAFLGVAFIKLSGMTPDDGPPTRGPHAPR